MLNKVILIGNLCADPEVRYMPHGGAVTNLRLATTRKWKDKQSGERKEETEFHRLTMFGKLAEISGEYLKKGSQAYFEGRIQTKKWQDQQGQDRYTTEIIAEVMHMIGGKRQDSNENRPKSGDNGQGYAPVAGKGNRGSSDAYDDFDDDIPF